MQDARSGTGRRRARAIVIALLVASGAVMALVATPRAAVAAAVPPWFGPNVRVDSLPSYSASAPSLAVGTNGVAYLAYSGWGGSTSATDIFFTQSADGGRTWSLPIRVNDDVGGATQIEPSLTLDASNNIYITWSDSRNGGFDVFFAKSITGGLSFPSSVKVNDVTTSFQWDSSVAVDSAGLIHAVWVDFRNSGLSGSDIYVANSTDGGSSFNPSQRLNNDASFAEQARPAIAIGADRSVYIAWDDPRNGGRGRDIYFSKSTNLGGTWTPNVVVNDDATSASQDNAVLAVDGGDLYLAWVDSRNPNTGTDIYATRSTNGGASFAASVKVNDEAGAVAQSGPAIAVRPGRVALTWADDRTFGSSSRDVYWASAPDGLTWGVNQRVNDDGLPTNVQSGATTGFDAAGNIFAAWVDNRASGSGVFTATLDVVAPTAIGGGGVTVDQGGSVAFDGAASADNFGIASYSWDFGDGSVATGASGTHIYATPGTFTRTLTVIDFSGNSASATTTITVQDTVTPQIAALEATVQVLMLAIIAFAIVIAAGGFLAYRQWRRSRSPPSRASMHLPPSPEDSASAKHAGPHHDPLDMAPPGEEPSEPTAP